MSKPGVEQLAWTDEQLSTFWGYYAEQRQEDYFTGLFGDRILSLTSGFFAADARVCDYGCGYGFLLDKLLRGHRAAGCDFAPANVDAVRRRLGGHPNFIGAFRIGEAPTDGLFDAVYVVETVEHVLARHESQFFENLAAVLRPGGVVIVTTPNAEDLAAETVFCPHCQHAFHRWQHVRSFDAASLSEFFRRCFDPVTTFTTDFSARTAWQRLKTRLRPVLGKRNPHLVYVGRKRG